VDKAFDFCKFTHSVFTKFISGQFVEAIILGVLCFIGMSVIRLPYALVISIFIGVTALIPVFGAFIGNIIGAFLILLVNPIQVIWYEIFLLSLQQVEGNLIYPRVVGSSIGLPAIWVLAAVTVGGGVLGVGGMLLGVPLAATVYKIVSNDVAFKNKKTETAEITE
jgi:predicted PurR-regulated permease PerM